jgi:hypothetical protein
VSFWQDQAARTFQKRAIERTADFRRIEAIPRRGPVPEGLVEKLTRELKKSGGTMTLRPIQAQALAELRQVRGLFAPIRVGGGKTLLSLLAPLMVDAKKPLLVLPASLVAKTDRERASLTQHWQIPASLRIVSYEMLGRVQSAAFLDFVKPDFLILDEGHRAKNKRAGVTRRLTRYLRENPETRVLVMSGSILKRSLRDFAHLIEWTHRDNAPVPLVDSELEEWASCLDEKVNPLLRVHPGALLTLATPEDKGETALETARKAFHRRLVDTPGVVSSGGDQVSCSLYLEGHVVPGNADTDRHFAKLRSEMETPDGWALTQAVDVWRHARELALGFHYVWDPRPPQGWLNARKAWAKFVRDVLSHSRTLDTELQVANAVRAGKLRRDEWDWWDGVRATFQINPKAIWHDRTALDWCAAWLEREKGIAWCEHTFFARELSRLTGHPYYGPQGLNAKGKPIESGSGPIIASVAANSTGRNLQRWNKNLVTSLPPSADTWEQMLGRTHRDGQEADEVTVDIMISCVEHADSWDRALADARMAQDMLGQPQKLLYADCTMPMAPQSGARWEK